MRQDALSLRHWQPPLLHHTRKDKGAKAIYDRDLGAISGALQESCIDKILHFAIPLLVTQEHHANDQAKQAVGDRDSTAGSSVF